MELCVAKPGRPPKNRPTIEPIAPAAWDRIRRLVARGAIEAIHGSQIGRLSYFGELTATEASAAFRVGEIYGRYDRVVLEKRRSARSPSYEMGFSGQTPEGQQRNRRLSEEEEHRIATRNFQDLRSQLPEFPRELRARIEDLCVEDTPISSTDLADVRIILGKLAAYFGIVSAGKNSIQRLPQKPSPSIVPGNVPTMPRQQSVESLCFRDLMIRILPKEQQNQIDTIYEDYCARRAREVLRRQKSNRSTRTVNPVSGS